MPLFEQIAFELQKPASELAFIVYPGQNEPDRVFFARHIPDSPVSAHAPLSAVVKLIQGIYDEYPDTARRIIRKPIYTTASPTEMCKGMIKVAAKRIRPRVQSKDHALSRAFRPIELIGKREPLAGWRDPETLASGKDFMRLAFQLAASVPKTGPRHLQSRSVAALLVSSDRKILGAAVNTNGNNRTLHAEINLLQGFFQKSRRGILPGSRIYSTLQPCKMCAGMIHHCTEDLGSLRVFFGEFDPGPHARMTAIGALARHLPNGAAADPEDA